MIMKNVNLLNKEPQEDLKVNNTTKDSKGKIGSKKRELKLTLSRALSDEIETKSRSLASLKRAKLKENRELNKKMKPKKILNQ